MLIVPQSCCIFSVSWGNLQHNNAPLKAIYLNKTMASHQQGELPSAFLPLPSSSWEPRASTPNLPDWCAGKSVLPAPDTCHWSSHLPHHWLSRSLDTEACKNKYPVDSSCDPFITRGCCTAEEKQTQVSLEDVLCLQHRYSSDSPACSWLETA